jgi:hypothetical protein
MVAGCGGGEAESDNSAKQQPPVSVTAASVSPTSVDLTQGPSTSTPTSTAGEPVAEFVNLVSPKVTVRSKEQETELNHMMIQNRSALLRQVDRVVSSDQGESAALFKRRGALCVFRRGTLRIQPEPDTLFEIEGTAAEQICYIPGGDPVAIQTPFGKLVISGTTIGISVDDNGVVATTYHGKASFDGASRSDSVPEGWTTRVTPSGQLGQSGPATLTPVQERRIASVNGTIASIAGRATTVKGIAQVNGTELREGIVEVFVDNVSCGKANTVNSRYEITLDTSKSACKGDGTVTFCIAGTLAGPGVSGGEFKAAETARVRAGWQSEVNLTAAAPTTTTPTASPGTVTRTPTPGGASPTPAAGC